MNTGSLVLGLINGMIVGFLAVGLVLVYRANRFLNLAHAQFGVISSLLLAKLVLDEGWNWWVAFVVCVPLGAGLAVAAYELLIRRLQARTRSTVVLLLASIGITQFLLIFAFIPAVNPSPTALLRSGGYPLPFASHVKVGGVVLLADNVLTVIVVPVLVTALVLVLRFTTFGRLVRAAAANPGEARLCGVPVQRISVGVWSIAGAMSAITAILYARSNGGGGAAVSGSAQGFGPELLLLALGAAALGGFRSIGLALAGGIGLGVAKQVTLGVTHDVGNAEVIVFGLILAVIVVRAKTIAAAFGGTTVDFEDLGSLVVPRSLAGSLLVRRRLSLLSLASLGLASLVPFLPSLRSDAHRFLLVVILIYAVVSVSLTVLMGWGGQLSLGHVGVLGAGAFVTARLVQDHVSLPLMMVVSGAVGAALMVIVGLPALRIPGLTLAVTTLGLAVVAPQWLYSQSFLGGTQAASGIVIAAPPKFGRSLGGPSSMVDLYFVALGVLGLTLGGAYGLRRSRTGRMLIAVRDNETAAESFGVTPAGVKLSVLAVSGVIAGVAGTLYALASQSVSSTQYPAAMSLSLLAVPVIGGIGSLSGAVLGALAVFIPTYFGSPALTPIFGESGAETGVLLVMTGVFLPFMLLKFPKGLAGALKQLIEGRLERAAEHRARTSADQDDPSVLPVDVHDVQISFGGIKALSGASITVRAGEILGLIGPNGAGKSTLLNVISGATAPDAGSVRLFGTELVGMPASFRAAFGLTRTFQNARLFPGLTVTEAVQVALSRRYRSGMFASMTWAPWARSTERRSADRAREVLARFGLTDWRNTLTGDLSTGTRRICDLALQVAAGAKVILLDEPTGGVAQREAEAFGPLLRQLRDELDCSIVIVEHDMPLLMGLCDRVYAMEGGRVIAEGLPEEIRADPAVIASYLGTDEVAIGRSGGAARRAAPARKRSVTSAKTNQTKTNTKQTSTKQTSTKEVVGG